MAAALTVRQALAMDHGTLLREAFPTDIQPWLLAEVLRVMRKKKVYKNEGLEFGTQADIVGFTCRTLHWRPEEHFLAITEEHEEMIDEALALPSGKLWSKGGVLLECTNDKVIHAVIRLIRLGKAEYLGALFTRAEVIEYSEEEAGLIAA